MDTKELLNTGSAIGDALTGWGEPSEEIRIGQKIRVTFKGERTKTGYAYKEEGAWLGIRYTWKAHRWWSLLNYNNPLTKLEVEEIDGEGKANYRLVWEK